MFRRGWAAERRRDHSIQSALGMLWRYRWLSARQPVSFDRWFGAVFMPVPTLMHSRIGLVRESVVLPQVSDSADFYSNC